MMKWILLFSLCSFGLQANAEQSVVIDSQSLGEQPATAKADANTAAPSDTQEDAKAINKQLILKSDKMSNRQRAAVLKGELADSNLQAGASFLASNKIKPGVVSLPSGMQYKILRAGKGKKPTENSLVRCHYKGTLIDGSTIDKSDEKTAAMINVSGFPAGLKEAVKLMPNGSKWEIVIPPELAYGKLGNRGIGPNAVLIYEMEILDVK